MKTQLGKFEGRDVQASVAKFSGKTASRVGLYAQGEFAIVIARVQVDKITHQDFTVTSGSNSSKLFSRIQNMTVSKAIVVDEKTGARLLEEAIQLADEQFGIDSLFSEITAETEPGHPAHIFTDIENDEHHCECEIGEDHFDFEDSVEHTETADEDPWEDVEKNIPEVPDDLSGLE